MQFRKYISSFFLFSKKVLITIIVIFPLALTVDILIGPIVNEFPTLIIAMIYVLTISPVMTLIMPKITKIFQKMLRF